MTVQSRSSVTQWFQVGEAWHGASEPVRRDIVVKKVGHAQRGGSESR